MHTLTASKRSAMANFTMLSLGRCQVLPGIGWLYVAPRGTFESTAAALGLPDHRKLVAWSVWVNHHENRPISFTSLLVLNA